MNYEMEELIPIVAELAEKYTGYESTSVTYENAEQLMGAVLYCINELERADNGGSLSVGKLPARQAYDTGMEYVRRKVEKALCIYNETAKTFKDYGNVCLYDTFIKGIPKFFKWYDVKYEPQNTILTLDYPVLFNTNGYTGIDRIYEYLECIRLEQIFLGKFPEEQVKQILSRYNPGYKDMIDNLCEAFVQEYYQGDVKLLEYLMKAMKNIVVRMLC